ncbi:DNA repair protein Rad50 [Perkinsela sp. CCAP 1560/4]|nr:DNA repair protein Rad50 [Perkinsela sp. CCAP 1560/4]|eukprot:KNH06487.1 DNA repair protein Rad50 [Perkinsela sp. CCAP 1560/4]
MACLHKIQICGIRSFSPQFEDSQTVVFDNPLTVILGRNGAGKTTIIEACLNATTGGLPVGADKGSFVHDPRVLGEREVRGQIRMTFRANTGQDMQVTRTFQSRVTKGKVVTQTVDASLAYKDAVTKKTTSGTFRCSDIDKIIPDLLGVSPSVLTNVIFCHQEDANWCFGTPAEVKKRLDDIFSSTKYVGALEKLKDSGKHYKQEVKQCEALLLLLEEHCTQAQKLRAEIAEKEQKAEELSKRALILQSEYDKVATAVADTDVLFVEITEAKEVSKRLDVIIRERNRSVQDIQAQLCTSDDLNRLSAGDDIEQILKANESEISRLEEQKVTLDAELQKISVSQSRLARATLESELQLRHTTDQWEALNRKADEVRHKIQPIMDEMEVALPELSIKADEYALRLQEVSDRINNVLQTHDHERNDTLTRYNSEIQEAESRQNVLYAEHSRAEARNEDLWHKIQDEEQALSAKMSAREDLKARVGNGRRVEEEKQAVRDLETELLASKNSLAQTGYGNEIASLQSQIESLEEEVEAVNATMRSQVERQDLCGKSSFLIASKRAKEKLLEDKLAAASDPLISVDSLRHQLSEAEKHRTEKRAEQIAIKEKLLNVEKSISSHEHTLQGLRKAQSTKTKEMEEKCKRLQKLFQDDFAQMLEDPAAYMQFCDKQCETLTNVINDFHTNAEQSKRLLTYFEETAECFTCGRGFRSKAQSEAFRQRIAGPDEREFQEVSIQKQKNTVSARETFRASYAEIIQLKHTKEVEIPALETEARHAEESLRERSEDRQEVSALDSTLQAACLELDDTITFMREIGGLLDEISTLGREIAAAGDIDMSEGQSLSELCQAQSDLQNRIGMLRKQQNDITHRQNEMKRRIEDVSQAFGEKLSSLQSLEVSIAQCSQITEGISVLEARIQALKENHQEIAQQVKETERAKAANEAVCASLKADRESHAHRMSLQVAPWAEAERVIAKFFHEIHSTNPHATREKMSKTQFELENYRREKENLLLQETNARETLEEIHTSYREKVSRHQLYEKAVQCRRIEAEVTKLRGDSASALSKMNGAESQIRSIFRTVEPVAATDDAFALLGKLQDRLHEIQQEAARLKGNIEPLVADISHRQASLLDVKYEDIERRMASTSIKLQTSQLVVNDIEKYYKALDHAVTKYHMDKITELNTIIENLWRSTYAGSDIDAIAIHVDEDANSTMSRRSFKYRVVMTKGDVELDLRGRCSAGQKVLASVLIRLALSEAFCCDCGILALDEPTTNLDEENVVALARALRNIIESRRNVKNFQLVVITHDESFVRALGHSTMCDSYYYVHKTVDGKYSQVEKQPIHSLFG